MFAQLLRRKDNEIIAHGEIYFHFFSFLSLKSSNFALKITQKE